jgi:hypothetical protein
MPKICDIEQLVKTYLVAQGFTSSDIFLQEFPINISSNDGKYLIQRIGSGELPLNISVDVAIVRIWARHTNPHTSYMNQKSVADLLHGLNPVNVSTSRFLFAKLVSGIERIDDTDQDIPQHAANYEIRVSI